MNRFIVLILTILFSLSINGFLFSQSRGVNTITERELKYHLEFLGAKEFRGRETPSPELAIATLYLGNWAKMAGLKPIMKDSSFYQDVPVIVTSVFQPYTKIRIIKTTGESVYFYGKAFGGNFSGSGSYEGNVVFLGVGINDPENGKDVLSNIDLEGKIVLIIDEPRPGTKYESGTSYYNRLKSIISIIHNKGASAVLSIISSERQRKLDEGFKIFEDIPSGKMATLFESQTRSAPFVSTKVSPAKKRSSVPFSQAEISHKVAADILGVTELEIGEMFKLKMQGQKLPSKVISNVRVRLDVEVETIEKKSRSVIAVVEGSDSKLKNEYVVVCGHHDGLGIRDGDTIPGADDNASATVALIEIAQALKNERPKRSVILAWFTGEEKGLNGSHYFINNCPVPVENISACLNMDMIGRNNPDSLYLVGSNLISWELDASINKVNRKSGINFGFDYKYSSLTHPQQVYFRSDQYPFIRFGIPGVWIFCGFTSDYHTPGDILEFIDYTKLLKVTKLVYLTAFEIGNMKELLKLDVNPTVTLRGKHNLLERSLFESTGK